MDAVNKLSDVGFFYVAIDLTAVCLIKLIKWVTLLGIEIVPNHSNSYLKEINIIR